MTTTTTEKTFTAPTTPEQAVDMVMSDAQFKKGVTSLVTKGKQLKELAHSLAINAIMKVYSTNQDNYNYLNALLPAVLNAMSASDAKKLIEWVTTYSPTRYVKTKDGFSFRKNGNEDAPAFDFIAGNENPYWTLGETPKDELETLLSATDFVTGVERIIKKFEKALDGEKVNTNDREIIQANIERLQAVVDANAALVPANGDGEATQEAEAA